MSQPRNSRRDQPQDLTRNVAWIASLIALALFILAWSGYRVHAADSAALRSLESRVLEIANEPRPVAQEVRDYSASLESCRESIEALTTRLSQLERNLTRTPAPRVAKEDTSLAKETVQHAPNLDVESDSQASSELEALVHKLAKNGWDFTENPESFERFLKLAKEGDALDKLIAELEESVAADPGDVEQRMALADTYLGKLMTASGPEQGLWGGRAEAQWHAVVKLDDANWDAHSSLGTTYGYYPEVMGKTGDAIRYLQRAREIQRTLEPRPEHVQVYLFLARMHEREGQRERAREVLLEGLQYHPRNEDLRTAVVRVE